MNLNIQKKVTVGIFLLILLVSLQAVTIYANDINTVEMWVTIHSDGSATIKEQWDITIDNSSNTEWYVAKHNLDNMEIQDLSVEEVSDDGTIIPFKTMKKWNVNASRQEKAQQCGLVRANGGYEVCWGFGELGRHKYNVSYKITNIVKGYEGGSAMSFKFLSDASGGVNVLNIYLNAENFSLKYPETSVWVFGYEAQANFVDGGINVLSNGRFKQSDYAVVLLAFEPNLISPADHREKTIIEIINNSKKGSIWEDDSPLEAIINIVFLSFPLLFIPGVVFLRPYFSRRAKNKKIRKAQQRIQRILPKNIDYSREIPFNGDFLATYVRLKDLEQASEGVLIGSYILKWVRSAQIEIIEVTKGLVFRHNEKAIRLSSATEYIGWSSREKELHRMFSDAAGKDRILRSKKFEKWSRKNYSKISGWISKCEKDGKMALINQGVYEEISVKTFFGLFNSTKKEITALGERKTLEMFGFKRYLEEFTIINEREACEVELWDDYLIFAHLLGIAERVSKQFAKLYPDYFIQPDGSSNFDSYDIGAMMIISESFSDSMSKGYQDGMSSSGDGGSSSSSGGGGDSSGGGGAGGR